MIIWSKKWQVISLTDLVVSCCVRKSVNWIPLFCDNKEVGRSTQYKYWENRPFSELFQLSVKHQICDSWPFLYLALYFNPFSTNVSLLYPLKMSENRWFVYIFKEHRSRTLVENGLMLFWCNSGQTYAERNKKITDTEYWYSYQSS